MKIYYILNDSVPYGSALENWLKSKNIHHFTQISNCFTTTSVASLLTGKLPSELESGGIGYGKNKSNLWKKEMLIFALKKLGFGVHFHNSTWFYSTLCKDEFIKKTTSMPCKALNEEKFRKTEEYTKLLLTPNSDYYKKESEFINKIQSEKSNSFYFIKNNQYHEAIVKKKDKQKAIDLMINWFKHWDFTEEDSMFLIFSDHHDFTAIDKLCQPPSFITWAFFKSNCLELDIKRNYVHISDFNDISSLTLPQSKNRIYFSEDARQSIDTQNSTTAIACKFTNWVGNKANDLIQVSYFKPENKYYGFSFNLDTKKVKTTNPNLELIEAIKERFSWIK